MCDVKRKKPYVGRAGSQIGVAMSPGLPEHTLMTADFAEEIGRQLISVAQKVKRVGSKARERADLLGEAEPKRSEFIDRVMSQALGIEPRLGQEYRVWVRDEDDGEWEVGTVTTPRSASDGAVIVRLDRTGAEEPFDADQVRASCWNCGGSGIGCCEFGADPARFELTES